MDRESLGDFIRRIRKEKRLSCADVSNQSARFGKRISGSYINRIENNPTLKPTADRLNALANGLGVPIHDLLARVIRIVPSDYSTEQVELLTRFRELSPERQADVLKIVDLWYQNDRCPKSA